VPYDSYSIHVDNEIKLLRNIKKFNRLPHVFLFKTGIAEYVILMTRKNCRNYPLSKSILFDNMVRSLITFTAGKKRQEP
jgi:hypothetical protein